MNVYFLGTCLPFKRDLFESITHLPLEFGFLTRYLLKPRGKYIVQKIKLMLLGLVPFFISACDLDKEECSKDLEGVWKTKLADCIPVSGNLGAANFADFQGVKVRLAIKCEGNVGTASARFIYYGTSTCDQAITGMATGVSTFEIGGNHNVTLDSGPSATASEWDVTSGRVKIIAYTKSLATDLKNGGCGSGKTNTWVDLTGNPCDYFGNGSDIDVDPAGVKSYNSFVRKSTSLWMDGLTPQTDIYIESNRATNLETEFERE